MKENRFFYLLLLVIMLAMCFIYNSYLMPYLLVVLILCPLISLALLIISYFTVEIKFGPDDQRAEKEEVKKVSGEIINKFFLPFFPMHVIGNLQTPGEYRISKKVLVFNVTPFSRFRFDFNFSLPYRGEYEFTLDRAEIYDIFKIFKLKKKLNMVSRAVIVPREIALESLRYKSDEDSDIPDLSHALLNKNTFTSLREYREGDSLRYIHWKLSARYDNLVVKEMERTKGGEASVYCDFNISYTESEKEKMRVTDLIIETALALAKKFIESGNDVNVYWREKQENRQTELRGPEDYGELYLAFSTLPPDSGNPNSRNNREAISGKGTNSFFSSLLTLFYSEEKTAYILTPRLNRDIAAILRETGYASRQNTVLITDSDSDSDPRVRELILNETKITWFEINSRNIKKILSETEL